MALFINIFYFLNCLKSVKIVSGKFKERGKEKWIYCVVLTG